MKLTDAAIRILTQLDTLIVQLQPRDFTKPSKVLGGATIGQHIRHTLEFFTCFEAGYHKGVVNYDKRSHDPLIETNIKLARMLIMRIKEFVQNLHDDKTLTLETGYDISNERHEAVTTNAMRELVYNIEHSVHHMAMIRIGVREVAPYAKLDHDFGIAASTIRHVALSESQAK